MIPQTTIKIENGDHFEDFHIYFCASCLKQLPECDPIHIENDEAFCPDCAYMNGFVSEEECKRFGYFFIGGSFYLDIIDGGVVAKSGKRRTNTQKDRRTSPEYSKWRTSVFIRDNYTCKICSQVGGMLNAHHILTYKDHKEERLNVDNGITLCKKCHLLAHSVKKKGGEK